MQRNLLLLLLLILGLWAGTAFGQQKPTQIVKEKISVPLGKTLTFHSRSAGAESWLWDFGDGNTAFSPDVSHRFAEPGSYTVRLEVTNGPCSEVLSREVEVFEPESVTEGIEGHLYPNPAGEQTKLELSGAYEGLAEVRLVSLQGQVLWKGALEKSAGMVEMEVPLGNLAAAAYLVQVQYGFEQQTLRLLKK